MGSFSKTVTSLFTFKRVRLKKIDVTVVGDTKVKVTFIKCTSVVINLVAGLLSYFILMLISY